MEKGSLLVLTQSVVQQNAPGQLANTQAQRDNSAANLYQRGKDAVAALPTGADLKLVETSGKAQELYSSGVEMANDAFAVAIRGGNLTTSVEGGSKAAAEVQERTGDFVNLRWDAESLSTTLHDQTLVWWAAWNFGDRRLAPWPDYPVAPQRNLKNYAEVITAFVDATERLEDRGFELDRQKALDEFELSEFVAPGKKPVIVVAPKVAPENDNSPAEPTGPATPEQT
jgi:phage gp29-like protein